jgi:hypothetical protein
MKKLCFLSLMLILSACGSVSTEDLCSRLAECADADTTQAECVAALDQGTTDAEKAGCTSEYDDYLSCVDGVDNVCSQDEIEAACFAEALAVFGCIGIVEDDQPG